MRRVGRKAGLGVRLPLGGEGRSSGLVDPHLGGEGSRNGKPLGEALRVGVEGSGEDGGAAGVASVGVAVVDVSRGHEAEARMVVLGVVPAEEVFAVGASVFEGAEARRKAGAVLEGFELASEKGLSSET